MRRVKPVRPTNPPRHCRERRQPPVPLSIHTRIRNAAGDESASSCKIDLRWIGVHYIQTRLLLRHHLCRLQFEPIDLHASIVTNAILVAWHIVKLNLPLIKSYTRTLPAFSPPSPLPTAPNAQLLIATDTPNSHGSHQRPAASQWRTLKWNSQISLRPLPHQSETPAALHTRSA